MILSRRFSQVDVFGSGPLIGVNGNPVAVVHDADGLSDEQMAAFARWTNLSETTFLLTPTSPSADYRLRIFTPGGELPFAGHPTLGSAHAWLAAGGAPRGVDIVQECGVGLVTVRRDGEDGLLGFQAPNLLRSGPVAPDDVARIARALGISPVEIVDTQWVDNGPGWVAARLASAAAVLALEPDFASFDGLSVGVVGLRGDETTKDGAGDVEVRAFVPDFGINEDPVTGSLNAGIGQWLAGSVLPNSYVAAQGTVIGRRGRLKVTRDQNGQVWVSGQTVTTISGEVRL